MARTRRPRIALNRLRVSTLLCRAAFVAPALIPGLAHAGPEGGVVAHGNASIAASGNVTTITQVTDRAVIDWQKFNLGSNEAAHFVQPGAGSVAVNRIGDANPSVIQGSLTANGQVVLLNPNGVLFGPNSHVDVQGLVVSTAKPSAQDAKDWAEGRRNDLPLSVAGSKDGMIVNAGTITAGEAGLVGFVAPTVINDGVIRATKGRVHLASGDTATLDLQGDGLVNIAVSDTTTQQLSANHGLIEADGGTVILSAAAGQHVANGVINMDGVIQARSISNHHGRIILSAEGSNAVAGNVTANKGKKVGNSTVLVSGVLDASGRATGQKGGHITVTGDNIALTATAFLDASGDAGQSGTTTGKTKSAARRDGNDDGSAGGEILIGGDYLGQGSTPNALNLFVEQGALILNDAISRGDAGRTILWSDHDTSFYGNVYARALGGKGADTLTGSALGGGALGDGGFVETSGHHHLDTGGTVDLTASNLLSARGTYFLDPTDITIYGNVDPSFVSTDGTSINLASTLKLWLDASDLSKVTLTYSTDALSSATATGTSGSTTLTTSADVSASLAVGARIRLGGAGSVTTASTLGANTYTISAISGTTITLSSALTTNYSGSTLYRGLISTLADKSSNAANATQATQANMPLWISNGQNGLGTAKFDGTNDYLTSNTYLSSLTSLGSFNLSVTPSGPASNSNSQGLLFWRGPSAATGINTGWSDATKWGYHWNDQNYSWTGGPSIDVAQSQILTVAYSPSNTKIVKNGGTASTNSASNILINDNSTVLRIGVDPCCGGRNFAGSMQDITIYNTVLAGNPEALLEQYQSAKWGIALTPSGSGATEAAKAMASTARGDATDGYSVFTTRYLERLSQTADISLQASNNINLDLKGDTINLSTGGRALTLTAGNQITTASAGAITTNGGAITFNATNGILLNNALTLTSNGGAINFNNALTSTVAQTFNSGAGTLTFGSTVNGAGALMASAGTFAFAGAWGGTTALGNVSLTSANTDFSLPNFTGAGNLSLTSGNGTITTGAISLAATKNLTISANDLVLNGDLAGTGSLVIQPVAASRNLYINYGAADGTNLNLSTADIAHLVNGWSQITVGRSDGSGNYNAGAVTWYDPINYIHGTYLNLNGVQTTLDNATISMVVAPAWGNSSVSFNSGSGIAADSAVSFNTASVWSWAPASITTTNDNISFFSGQIGMWGNTFTLNAGTAAINFSGIGGYGGNLVATANTINTSGAAWGVNAYANAVGVNLTSLNNIALPQINGTNIYISTNGAVTQTGALAASSVKLLGTGGSYTLTNTSNAIGTLAANTGGVSVINGNTGLTIGTVNGTSGITTTGNTVLNTGTGTITTSSTIAVGSGNLTLTADDMVLGANLSGTGIVTLQPSSVSRQTKVNYGTADGNNLNLSTAEIGYLADGWSQINIGSSTQTNYLNIGDITFTDPVLFRAGVSMAFNGNLTGTGNASFTTAMPTIYMYGSNITTAGGNLDFSSATTSNSVEGGSHTITSNGGNVTFRSLVDAFAGNLTVNSGGGNITLINGITTSSYGNTSTWTFNAGSGTLAFGNTINTAMNITGSANNVTFNGAWGASKALSSISLTSPNSFTLPNLTSSGNITLNGKTGTITTGTIATGAGNLTLMADDLVIGGNLSGTGTLNLTPYSTSRIVRVNSGTGDFNIDSTEIARLVDGWSSIVIGNGVWAPSQAMYIGNNTWTDPVTFLSGNTQSVSSLTGTGNASFTFNNGGLLSLGAGAITTAGGAVSFGGGVVPNGNNTITTNGGAYNSSALYYNGPVSLTINTGGGAQNFNNVVTSGYALSSLNLNAGSGAIGFNNTINTAGSVTANGGSFSFNGAWGGSTPLGNVSLTSTNTNFTMPNLTSTGNVTLNAGTGTITSGNIGIGTGNLTLTADDVALGGSLTGLGTILIKPSSGATVTRVNAGVGGFNLSTAEINLIAPGWNRIQIGRDTGYTNGNTFIGASNWSDSVDIFGGGGITVNGDMNAAKDLSFNIGQANFGVSVNGNIAAGGNINFNTSLGGSGTRTISSGGNINLNGNATDSLFGFGTINFSVPNGTLSVPKHVGFGTAINANAHAINLGGTWDPSYIAGNPYPVHAVSLVSDLSLALPIITSDSMFIRTTGATSDITVPSGHVLTATNAGNALTVVAGRNFVNNGGSGALALTGGGRWLVYSADPSANTLGGLSSGFNRYSCGFSTVGACAGGVVTVPAAGNGLLYSSTPLLTVTPTVQSIIYGNGATLAGYGYALSGYSSGDAVADGVTGSLTGTSSYAAGSDIGTYGLNYVSGSLASAMGYGFTYASNANAIVVGQRTLTAGLAGTVSKTYDGTLAATLAAGNYTLSNLYGSDGSTVLLNNPASGSYDTKDHGTGKTVSVSGLSISGAKSGNYTLAANSISGSVGTILTRTLTAGLTGTVSKTYDTNNTATLAAGNYTLSNVVGSEDVVLNKPGSGSYDTIHVGGGKTVSVSGLSLSGADTGNYTLASTNTSGSIGTILAKVLNAGLTGNVSKTYDTNNSATLAADNYTLDAALGSDVVTLNNPVSGTYDTIHAGTGKTVSVIGLVLSGANASDYTLASTNISGLIGTILSKTLNAGLTGAVSKTYDTNNSATLAANNYTLDAALGSDVVTLNKPTNGNYDTIHAGTGKTVSVNGLTLSGANAGDYVLASNTISGNIGEIIAKVLTAGLTGTVSKTYDATNNASLSAGNYLLGGSVLGSDAVALNNPGSGTYDTIHAGTGKTVSVNGLTLSGANASDYALSATSISGAVGRIDAKGLDVTVTAGQHKTYGDANPTSYAYSYSGLEGSDSAASFTGALSRAAGEHAGLYAIRRNDLAASGDYAIATFTGADFGIDKAHLTIVAPLASRPYGDANPSLAWADATITGLKNSESGSVLDTLNFAIASTANATAHAGSTHAISIGSFADNDYVLDSSTNGLLTIGKRDITAAWNGTLSKIYGTANPGVSSSNFTYANMVNGDAASLITASADYGTTNANSNVGSYSVGATFSANDYRVTNAPTTTLSISPRALSVSIANQSKTYGDTNPVFTGTPNGLTSYDLAQIGWNYAPVAYAGNAGSYAIAATATDPNSRLSNYTRTDSNGLFTVNKRTIGAAIDNQSRIYGDANPVLGWQNVTWSNLAPGDTAASIDSLTLTYANTATPTAHANTQHIIHLASFADNNYTLGANTDGTLRIGNADLLVKADDKTRLVIEPNPTFTATSTGWKNNDGPSLLSGLAFSAPDNSAAVGFYNINPYGVLLQDYNVAYNPGTLLVTSGALPSTVEQGQVVQQITYQLGQQAPAFTDPSLAGISPINTNKQMTGLYGPPVKADAHASEQELSALQTSASNESSQTSASIVNTHYLMTLTPEMQKLLSY